MMLVELMYCLDWYIKRYFLEDLMRWNSFIVVFLSWFEIMMFIRMFFYKCVIYLFCKEIMRKLSR